MKAEHFIFSLFRHPRQSLAGVHFSLWGIQLHTVTRFSMGAKAQKYPARLAPYCEA
jgi:hypothetical protein